MLNDLQHSFKKHRFTQTALLAQNETILQASSAGQYVVGIYSIDFPKAFDISHSILLCKLKQYEIRGTANDLPKLYYNQRIQYIDISSDQSSLQSIHAGVPRAIILQALLFTIYVNDIAILQQECPIYYANDTPIFIMGM